MYKISNKDLLNSAGNHTQYLVIIYNRKESKKEYIYMCVCVCVCMCVYVNKVSSLCCILETNTTL